MEQIVADYLRAEQRLLQLQDDPNVKEAIELVMKKQALFESLKDRCKELRAGLDYPFLKVVLTKKKRNHYKWFMDKMKDFLWFNSVITIDEKKFQKVTDEKLATGELTQAQIDSFAVNEPTEFYSAELKEFNLVLIESLDLSNPDLL